VTLKARIHFAPFFFGDGRIVRYRVRESDSKGTMESSWVTERVALGGGICELPGTWQELTQAGVTHVVNMQLEFERPAAGGAVWG